MALELELRQKQTLTQRMLQSVTILQMAAQELDQYINDLALENPVMDVKEKSNESIEQQQWLNSLHEESHYLYQRQNNDDDYNPKDSWNINTDHGETLYEYLYSQLVTEDFSPREQAIIDFILKSLDDKGYLTESVEHIGAYFHESPKMVQRLLNRLQKLEPAGVCARNLQECLKIQLSAKGLLDSKLEEMIDSCLEQVARHKISAIAQKLAVSPGTVTEYCRLIQSLNPKPGSAFYNHEEMKYIIPDVMIVKFHSHFDILLNESMYPEITVNHYYQKMDEQSQDAQVKEYLDKKIRQAEWVRHCIAQRGQTLIAVSREILKNQEDFFVHGPQYLRPLKLADVAQAAGIHESTVSRAVNNKYLQCSWGVYPMAFFFQRNAVHTTGFSSDEEKQFTPAKIKQAIREIIQDENKKKPYSDRLLSELLAEKGISISRRTVAKYREEEGIPDASGRKNYL